MSLRMTAVFATTIALSILLTATVRTQTLPGAQDALGALLTEVRALRTTIEAVASAGATGQLMLGRLQLQEQRVNGVVTRLESIRSRLVDAQRGARFGQEDCARSESWLKDGNAPAGIDREELENAIKRCRTRLTESATEIQGLAAEETELAAQLAAEQARWFDLNRRLEEIELTLTKRR